MIRKLALAVLVFAMASASVTALAADFNGKWNADMEMGPLGPQPVTFDFHVDGSKMTGTITSPMGEGELIDGKVAGDNISFAQIVTFPGNEIKINFSGTRNGDTIKFTRQAGDSPAPGFDAKRGEAASVPAPSPAPPQ